MWQRVLRDKSALPKFYLFHCGHRRPRTVAFFEMRKKPIVCLETRSRKEADLPSSVGWMASSSCPKGGKGNGGGGSTCQNIRSGEIGGGEKMMPCWRSFVSEIRRNGESWRFFSLEELGRLGRSETIWWENTRQWRKTIFKCLQWNIFIPHRAGKSVVGTYE